LRRECDAARAPVEQAVVAQAEQWEQPEAAQQALRQAAAVFPAQRQALPVRLAQRLAQRQAQPAVAREALFSARGFEAWVVQVSQVQAMKICLPVSALPQRLRLRLVLVQAVRPELQLRRMLR
jgi:hypothetical protein